MIEARRASHSRWRDQGFVVLRRRYLQPHMSHPCRSLIRSSLEHLRRLWQRRDSGRREIRRRLGTTFEMLEPRLALTISAPLPPAFPSTGAHIHPFLTLIE